MPRIGFNNPQLPTNVTKDSPKLPQTPTPEDEGGNINIEASESLQNEIKEQNRKIIEDSMSMLHDYQEEAHQLAVAQWNLKRRERKQLEKDLLQYQVSSVQGGYPTDQEIEQARVYLNNQHAKKLREELPYINRYFETLLASMEIEDNDGLSESSAGSYEAREEWNEEDCRKLMINFNRNQAQYAVDRRVKEIAVQRDPENILAIEKEYSNNREHLDYRQKRGLDLIKVAKSFTDYARRQNNFREKIRQEEIQKTTRRNWTSDGCSMEIARRRVT